MVPNREVDRKFLKAFVSLIKKYCRRGERFIIITGGGSIARSFQEAAKSLGVRNQEDLDWIGIQPTRLNAELLRSVFGVLAHPGVLVDPRKKHVWKESILVGAGWRPGRSTDYAAVVAAKVFRAKMVINLSDIDYVYDRDPKKYKSAKKLTDISWQEFKKIVGSKWVPGANLPFDPVASALAQRQKVRVIIMNGRKLGELEKAIKNQKFRGTTIG